MDHKYYLLGLALMTSHCRHSDNSSKVQELAISYGKINPLVIPILSGCFEVPLIKTGSALPAEGQNYFDRTNCEYLGEDSRSASIAINEWKSSANLNPKTGFRRGCYSAFTAPPDPHPKYKFILRVSDIASTSSTTELKATYSLKTIPMSPPASFNDNSGVTRFIIQSKEDFIQGSAIVQISPEDSTSMKIYLEKSGNASGLRSPVAFHYDRKSATILKYFGHVAANFDCN